MNWLGTYTLVGKVPTPCLRMMRWARWMETADRRVAEDYLTTTVDGEKISIRISTVFLGLDHSFGNGDPLLFETMIFGGPNGGEQARYHTWAEAEDGHQLLLNREQLWLHNPEQAHHED